MKLALGRRIAGRTIKIVGNGLKPSFYIFHYFWPTKRFRIPAVAKPILPTNRARLIPRIIWQTNYTDMVTLPVYVNWLFNRMLAPDCEFRFASNAERSRFISETYSAEIFDCFSRLQIGAAQADFWRALVLMKHGGVYMDIDAHLVWPLARMLAADQPELFIRDRNNKLTNYFIASRPGNPLLGPVIDTIVRNIKAATERNIFNLTGPGAFSEAVPVDKATVEEFRFVSMQGNITNGYFQYVDKPAGKWYQEQSVVDIVRRS